MSENKFKQICECKNCGNEAEMEITCKLENHQVDTAKVVSKADGKVKGHAVCTNCGGEADIWLDI